MAPGQPGHGPHDPDAGNRGGEEHAVGRMEWRQNPGNPQGLSRSVGAGRSCDSTHPGGPSRETLTDTLPLSSRTISADNTISLFLQTGNNLTESSSAIKSINYSDQNDRQTRPVPVGVFAEPLTVGTTNLAQIDID